MTKTGLAIVFPGQGSQKIGMLADLAESFNEVQDTFTQASAVLGYDLWDLVQNGEQAAINQTEVTQPLMLTASIAIWRIWIAQGGATPAMLAGHSLGEWSALVAAGVVALEDAVRLVQQRGKFMQEAVPSGVGAMAAVIGLDDESIKLACADASNTDEVAVAVNFNSPGQVVIAGHAAAIDRAIAGCKERGAKRALPLPVSAPFHTPLMKPAAEKLALLIEETVFNAPQIPVVHNVDAGTESDPQKIKALMIEQIYSPVLWVDCVETMQKNGVTTLIEVGPGKVLAGLVKRIDKSLTAFATETPDDLSSALESQA